MEKRIQISSGTSWEKEVGYARGVRVGSLVEIAGTTAIEAGKVIYPLDAYKQTQYILLKIEQALKDLGADITDVVRTRIFTTDIDLWTHIGRAHGEVFKEIQPVATMVEVSALIQLELVVEIEVTAWVTKKE
ncbi:MAG: RidA family protein [Bacteroidota bacterium]